MEYSFVAVVFVVVVITACAQWAVALLELRKHSAARREHEEEHEEIRVRAHLCYFNYFICAELQREEDREREQSGIRGACETTIFPSLTFRLQFACANSKTHDCHTKLKCSPFSPFFSFSPSLAPSPSFFIRPFVLFGLILFYFILSLFYFILLPAGCANKFRSRPADAAIDSFLFLFSFLRPLQKLTTC